MSVLAINGGKKIRTKLFPAYRVIGAEEQQAVSKVLESGILSKYLGRRFLRRTTSSETGTGMGGILWRKTCYFRQFSYLSIVLCGWSNWPSTWR